MSGVAIPSQAGMLDTLSTGVKVIALIKMKLSGGDFMDGKRVMRNPNNDLESLLE